MTTDAVRSPARQEPKTAFCADEDRPPPDTSLYVLCTLGRILAGRPPISEELDWESMAALARRHGVSPLLFWRLHEANAGGGVEVPGELRAELREDLYTAAAHGVVAERQLAEVLKAFHVAHMPSIVVKGAAVAAFYPDPALRRSGDLDLWLRQEDLPVAEQVLLDLGYSYIRPKAWWLRQFQHLPPLERRSGGVHVELHWRLDSEQEPGRLPLLDLWARAVPWSIAGQPALRLDPVDTVLHLCRHAVIQHRARLGLRPLCDLAQVTEDWAGAEWESLVQRSEGYALARPVYLMLSLMEQVLDQSPPALVMTALKPPDEAFLPEDSLRLFMELDGDPAFPVPMAFVQAKGEGTATARLRSLLWHLFLPRDGMGAVYDIPTNSPRIWLTYLWRPLDLVMRYGRSTWRLLRRQQASQVAWSREAWLEAWLEAGEE
jgi:hypothetical protein